MRLIDIDRAVEIGYRQSYGDMPRVITRCEFATGCHAFCAALEQNSGFLKAMVLRAVMGWITDYKRRHGCT